MSADVVLRVKDLRVEFDTFGGVVQAVRGASFDLRRGKTLAIVGESGSGKSVTVQTLMGLIPIPPGRITSGSVLLEGREVIGEALLRSNRIRGREIGMIFQDPMTSLNPTLTVGEQIAETLRVHRAMPARDARRRALELLEQVRIPDARARIDQYPFQFSGGMRQRVLIAMAIACDPKILIADEPTTALDVTIQAQILALLKELQRERGMSVILITHDLGVVAQAADDVSVMYGGQIVESGTVDQVFDRPSHPYTLGLQAALPRAAEGHRSALRPIEGSPPDLFDPPPGCAYFARCPNAMRICASVTPTLDGVGGGQLSRCWLHDERAAGEVMR